jgi:hypothetical protein
MRGFVIGLGRRLGRQRQSLRSQNRYLSISTEIVAEEIFKDVEWFIWRLEYLAEKDRSRK